MRADWGTTDKNRRAKFYTLTAEGESHLTQSAERWTRYAEAVFKVLGRGEEEVA